MAATVALIITSMTAACTHDLDVPRPGEDAAVDHGAADRGKDSTPERCCDATTADRGPDAPLPDGR